MTGLIVGIVVVGILALILLALTLHIVQQYEKGTLIEIGVDKNTTVVFPGPLMSTIQEMGAFLSRETVAIAKMGQPSPNGRNVKDAGGNGSQAPQPEPAPGT